MNVTGGAEGAQLTAAELEQRIQTGEPLILIDVREPYEWAISNLAPQGARLIPLAELSQRMAELDPATDIVVYCRTGGRSDAAARHLRAHGFERVWSLRGGVNGWAQDVDPSLAIY